MSDYFDKFGKQVTMSDYMKLIADTEYCRLKKTEIAHIDGDEEITISTVWLPGYMTIGNDKTPTFETLIFGGQEDGWVRRTKSIEEADRTHNYAVHLCTGLREKDRA